jgi:hypothetical protein
MRWSPLGCKKVEKIRHNAPLTLNQLLRRFDFVSDVAVDHSLQPTAVPNHAVSLQTGQNVMSQEKADLGSTAPNTS